MKAKKFLQLARDYCRLQAKSEAVCESCAIGKVLCRGSCYPCDIKLEDYQKAADMLRMLQALQALQHSEKRKQQRAEAGKKG